MERSHSLRRMPVVLAVIVAGCAAPRPGTALARRGDEIVICGRLVHTGATVVLWTDPGGYDAYRVMRRFEPGEMLPSGADAGTTTPNRYGDRPLDALSPEERDRVRDRGWDLPELQRIVHQFVLHYDVCGTSRECFRILHDVRGLSVHFLLDLDGTIYQTLDLKERARHAGAANDRSVGIEIAQIGAYTDMEILSRWYRRDDTGRMRVVLPERLGDGHLRTAAFVARPVRDDVVRGEVHGQSLVQYDFTPQQYDSLVRLAATLCRVFPLMNGDVPRDPLGNVRRSALSSDERVAFSGILGHFHVSAAKTDPGPAFDWERLVGRVRRALEPSPRRPLP